MEDYSQFNIYQDPFKTFDVWYSQALNQEKDPAAFSLATVDQSGRPNSRMLLYKGKSDEKFCFYTNRNSTKAKEMQHAPFAAMNFYWPIMGRQIRLRGSILEMPVQKAQEYFRSRARESQIASIVSSQSEPIESKKILVKKFQEKLNALEGMDIPFDPEKWAGYYLVPAEFEFFLYGEHRLNDRFLFKNQTNRSWSLVRLQP